MTTVLKLIVTTLASLLLFSCSFDCVRGEASGNASSGAEISLTVKKSFKANASSGGDINYYGNPENIDIKDSSGGNVDKL